MHASITGSNRLENDTHSSLSLSSKAASSRIFLNCSRYTSLSSYFNTSIQTMSFQARLHACFSDYPYDTSQLPLPPSTNTLGRNSSQSLELTYDYSVHYLIDFQNSCITLFGQLSLWWRDSYREWDVSELPVSFIEVPLSEIWHPRFQFVSTISKRSMKLLDSDDVAVLFPQGVRVFRRNVLESHCNIDYARFPFDTQVCGLQFELERYFFEGNIDVILVRANYTYQFLDASNEEWELLSMSSVPVSIR